MQRRIAIILAICLASMIGLAQAGPQQDIDAFQMFFKNQFPGVTLAEFGDGIYAIDDVRRDAWMNFEEFPPYEEDVEKGDKMFHTAFANGKGYADCFRNYKKGIRQDYPKWDADRGEVMTLEWAINLCREANGEKPLKYKKGAIAQLGAYLTHLSVGNKINVVIPDDPRALDAYEDGKRFYYSKRGQLNFSCANCHVDSPGKLILANLLSPAVGQTSHFPVYRKKWKSLGTLQRRYGGCNKQVRAKAFKAQGSEYRNLEYFHTAMSNGVPINGPASRQ